MDKLVGVLPDLVDKVKKIQAAMAALGFTMIPTDGLRTTEQQQALWNQGRFGHPGPIVTNADGVKDKSNHQAHEDGFGHAVDMCFVVDGKASWDPKLPWRLYGEMAKALGCVWGGDWISPVDKPHIQE